jgi:hypothetical protein
LEEIFIMMSIKKFNYKEDKLKKYKYTFIQCQMIKLKWLELQNMILLKMFVIKFLNY